MESTFTGRYGVGVTNRSNCYVRRPGFNKSKGEFSNYTSRLKSLKMYHTRQKVLSPYYSRFLPYILIP